MVFENGQFDSLQWEVVKNGLGEVTERTSESFKASVQQNGDFAGLVTTEAHDLKEQGLVVYVNRMTPISIIVIRPDKNLVAPFTPAVSPYVYTFKRDATYGLLISDGTGFLLIKNDHLDPSVSAEMQISVTAEGIIEFYYDKELVFSQPIKSGFDTVHIYLLVTAKSYSTIASGTTTFKSTETIIPPPQIYALSVNSEPFEGVPVTMRRVS